MLSNFLERFYGKNAHLCLPEHALATCNLKESNKIVAHGKDPRVFVAGSLRAGIRS